MFIELSESNSRDTLHKFGAIVRREPITCPTQTGIYKVLTNVAALNTNTSKLRFAFETHDIKLIIRRNKRTSPTTISNDDRWQLSLQGFVSCREWQTFDSCRQYLVGVEPFLKLGACLGNHLFLGISKISGFSPNIVQVLK